MNDVGRTLRLQNVSIRTATTLLCRKFGIITLNSQIRCISSSDTAAAHHATLARSRYRCEEFALGVMP